MQITKIWHIGNSNVITVSKKILSLANMDRGDNVAVSSPCPGSILIKCCNFKELKTNEKKKVINEN